MKDVMYFIKYLYAHSGRNLYVALMGMVMISLLEGAGIIMLLPMLRLSGIVDFDAGVFTMFKDFWIFQDIQQTVLLPLILGIFILLVAGQNYLQKFFTIRNTKIQQNFTTWLRIELYSALLRASWDLYIQKRKSDLIHALTSDYGRVSVGVYVSLQFLASLVFMLIQLGLAFWLSSKLTLMILLCGVMLAFLSRKRIQQSKRLGGKSSDIAKSYLAGMTDQLNGMKEIKSNTLEQSRMVWVRRMSRLMNEEQLEFIQLKASSQFTYKVASAAFIAVFIWLFFNLFHAEPGQLLLIFLIFSRLWPRFTGIQANLEQIAMSVPSLKALLNLQRECEEVREIESLDHDPMNEQSRISILNQIEFREVHFKYQAQEGAYALQQINLQIPANRMTAIVGRSGAGKSTFIDLVMGLLQPSQGVVLLDDIPLTREKILQWRKSISYVPQEPFLFNASIRENLLMMEPDADEGRIWGALTSSSAADFVNKLPQGLDTVIGDRGIRLSGGERQRIVLARALLCRPSILILDEATSALDTENEKKIQEAIQRMKGKMTIIVVAHRLSTIRNADQIIVLDQGRIVQTGRYNQLATEKKGLFRSLLGHQVGEVELVLNE
ncbi:ATP-binding cassette domain-containing protein [Paenibacillus sp. LMG 31456]|uniref:ATP-binding cassette domain-containing protein n=1 Tax=Paenibacillus foliorum TaxID=2654974 RepID=A0A972JX97_9BACL|nr:ABC transporter ATP-binding protein [Paenibacillus foliorum]NOU92244.1 ATP-binding cassette domain-containing protein [Paenibacillus foliorum]